MINIIKLYKKGNSMNQPRLAKVKIGRDRDEHNSII